MLLVADLALAFAALTNPSELGSSALFTLTVLILATATLAATARDGPTRAYWRGFSLFGWTYLYLTLGLPYGADDPRPRLVSSQLIVHLCVHYGVVEPNHLGQAPFARHVTFPTFQCIAESQLALVVGAAGGWLSRWLDRRDRIATTA